MGFSNKFQVEYWLAALFLSLLVPPVELLYRRLADVRRDVGKREAPAAYEALEKERQEKLEKCRKIRNELLMQGYPHCSSSSCLREHQSNRSSPRTLPGPPQDHARGSVKSDAGSPDSNRTQIANLRGSSSPFPSVSNVEAPPAFVEVSPKPIEVRQSPVPLLPVMPRTTTNSPDERSGKRLDETTSMSKGTPKQRRKYVRSLSLPSRPATPNVRATKPFSRNASSLDNYDRKLPADIFGSVKNCNSRNSGSLISVETSGLDQKQEHHVSFEDINNNNFKAPIIMRPNSSRKKRQMEKRKLIECKKVFDKIQAQYKDPEYCLLKYRQIIENSIERELREQEVKKVQRRIEEGFEMWQDRILMLHWLDNERAEEQVSQNMSTKIERMRQKQRNKEIIHSINMNKVKEEDDIKAEILRRELVKKEKKIQVLHEEKERVICESKSRAQAVSELKEQIRNIMTPETFDRKVNKCGRESKVHRVLHPPAKCPAIMQRSHITLG